MAWPGAGEVPHSDDNVQRSLPQCTVKDTNVQIGGNPFPGNFYKLKR